MKQVIIVMLTLVIVLLADNIWLAYVGGALGGVCCLLLDEWEE